MADLCPANCADFDLVEVLDDACTKTERKRGIKSIGFYKCDVVLPKPLTAAALTELVAPEAPAVPALVFSNPLANVSIEDPATETRKISDSMPDISEVTGRTVTFQDRIKVDVTEATTTIWKDYEFWKDKKEHKTQLMHSN